MEAQLLYNLTKGCIANAIAAAECHCMSSYGDALDPQQPLWTNVNTALANMNPNRYFARPSNMAYHNLCTKITPPPGCASLLGLGHKYCIQTTGPVSDTKTTIFCELPIQIRAQLLSCKLLLLWGLVLTIPSRGEFGEGA